MKKHIVTIIIVFTIALLLGLAWGIEVHRKGIFPYAQLHRLGQSLGLVKGQREWNVKADRGTNRKALIALGYVATFYDPNHEERGVLDFDPERTWPSVRFYTSEKSRYAHLIDLDGTVLKEWSHPTDTTWQFALLLDGGDIIVMRNREGFIRLTPDSQPVWSIDVNSHHDLCLFEDTLYTLTMNEVKYPEIHPKRKVLEEYVSRYTLDGELIDRISLLELIRNSPYRFLLPTVHYLEFRGWRTRPNAPLDIIHSNHVEVFDGSLADRGEIYRRGNIMISSRHLNLMFIFDPASREIVWIYGPGNLVLPHHPVLLDTGRILMFNNGTKESEVVELDPLDYRVHWRYTEDDFFSKHRGSNQRLPNGNTLITESDTGRVFEVTPEGEIVWRFANPDVNDKGHRGVIFRMTAYAPNATPFIASLTGGS